MMSIFKRISNKASADEESDEGSGDDQSNDDDSHSSSSMSSIFNQNKEKKKHVCPFEILTIPQSPAHSAADYHPIQKLQISACELAGITWEEACEIDDFKITGKMGEAHMLQLAEKVFPLFRINYIHLNVYMFIFLKEYIYFFKFK